MSENKDDGDAADKKGGKGKGGGATSTGFGAGAVEERFYGRDAVAEYKALDCDRDDDVNVGEDEMMDDGGGYGGGGDENMLYLDEDGVPTMMVSGAWPQALNVKATADTMSSLLGEGIDALDASKSMPRIGAAAGIARRN